MRSIAQILSNAMLTTISIGLVTGLTACASGPVAIPDQRPGDFRLGVVVMTPEDTISPKNTIEPQIGGDGRYIVDASSVLRASFGAGSTLDTFPGYTRRLNHEQMDALWLMTRGLLERRLTDPTFGMIEGAAMLHAGQPQSLVGLDAGTIIEIHMNAHDEVLVFDPSNQQAAAVVDALSGLAWVDTLPTLPSQP